MKNRKQCRLDAVQIVDVAVQQAVAQMRCPETLLSPRTGELCDNGSEIPLTLLPSARRGEGTTWFKQHNPPAQENREEEEENWNGKDYSPWSGRLQIFLRVESITL